MYKWACALVGSSVSHALEALLERLFIIGQEAMEKKTPYCYPDCVYIERIRESGNLKWPVLEDLYTYKPKSPKAMSDYKSSPKPESRDCDCDWKIKTTLRTWVKPQ